MNSGTIITIALLSAVFSTILMAIIFRKLLSIKKILWNQKQQINLLIRMAKEVGINEQDQQLLDINARNNYGQSAFE